MSVDVLVVGGGVAGLSAAVAAVEAGASVEVIEAGATFGGSALLSNGSLWTFGDVSTYLEHCPGADPRLAERTVTGLPVALGWLRDRGVVIQDRGPSLYGAESSYQVTPGQLVGRLLGDLRHRATMTAGQRVTAFESAPEGILVTTDAGREILAGSMVLATGGIHADSPMLIEAGLLHYVDLPIRNRPVSGDGVRLAIAQGARVVGTADGIYGHLVPTGLAPDEVTSPLAAQYQSYAGALIGLDGSLLASPGTDDHDLNRLMTRQTARRAVLFFDASAAPPRILSAVGGTSWAGDRAAFATAHGRHATSAATVAELLATVARWGLDALSADSTVAVTDALTVAPFAAVEVEPSITHAGAGISVDASLHAAGLDNVFVGGADIGAGFGDGYGGGLSFALTTGMAAGREAATAGRCPGASRILAQPAAHRLLAETP